MTALLYSGCLVTSIHPLGTEDDIVFDENLIGVWYDDEDSWIFLKKDDVSMKSVFYLKN